MTRYEVVKATSVEDAVTQSRWKVGDQAKCTRLTAVANNVTQGTYSVFPEFEKMDIIGDLEVDKGD